MRKFTERLIEKKRGGGIKMILERLKIETNDHNHFTNRAPVSMN